VPRRRHVKAASKEQQAACKKSQPQGQTPPAAEIQTWVEAEARVGLTPLVRRVWTRTGERPLARSWHKDEWLSPRACVRPTTGRSEWVSVPAIHTQVINLALKGVAPAVGAGRKKRRVLRWEQAAWPKRHGLAVSEGIPLLDILAYTPELQPAERMWPVLKEGGATEPIEDRDKLEEKLGVRWRDIIAPQQVVRGLTNFHWWPNC
jgi:hypothetical protein